jgi:hypothetical protein
LSGLNCILTGYLCVKLGQELEWLHHKVGRTHPTILAGSYVWPDNKLIKRIRITIAEHCWSGEPV